MTVPLNPRQNTILEVANNSTRVRDLLASTIQAGVYDVFGHLMSFQDARDVARVHTLDTALAQYQEKLRIHQHIIDRERRNGLIVTELKLTPTAQVVAFDEIVVARRATFQIGVQADRNAAELAEARLEMLRVVDQIKEWSGAYRTFLRALARKYREKCDQLDDLALDQEKKTAAFEELEQVFIDAVERSMRL